VEESGIESFKTVSRFYTNTLQGILNFLNNRSVNASVRPFNAKIKAFRASARGVRGIKFFLFRLAKSTHESPRIRLDSLMLLVIPVD
jgi:transposase